MRNSTFGLLVVSLVFLIMAGCSHYPKNRDGAPKGYVDVSRIPNAKPRYLPRSRYGNPSSYVINGRRYYVLKSARGYNKRGIASWYGTKFHGRLTSTREPYNMYAMTAASPELPLPTFVRVTNLENGRQVIVKVNDRGPFARNRILDLSYVAAIKLGVTKHGTAMVQVTAIDPTKSLNDYRDYTTKRTNYVPVAHQPELYLQAGAFSRYSGAIARTNRIKRLTHAPVNVIRSGKLYKVQIGPLGDVANSDRVENLLEIQGIETTTSIER